MAGPAASPVILAAIRSDCVMGPGSMDPQPKLTCDAPPGGASTRLLGRSDRKLPTCSACIKQGSEPVVTEQCHDGGP